MLEESWKCPPPPPGHARDGCAPSQHARYLPSMTISPGRRQYRTGAPNGAIARERKGRGPRSCASRLRSGRPAPLLTHATWASRSAAQVAPPGSGEKRRPLEFQRPPLRSVTPSATWKKLEILRLGVEGRPAGWRHPADPGGHGPAPRPLAPGRAPSSRASGRQMSLGPPVSAASQFNACPP